MNTPTESDKRAADAIYDATWGTREAIWPGVDAIAQIIAYHMAAEREALRMAKEALNHISLCAHELCAHYCGEHYIPRGIHSPECPNEYYSTADSALAAIEKVML